jgi:hypothetical protein
LPSQSKGLGRALADLLHCSAHTSLRARIARAAYDKINFDLATRK